MNLRLLCVLLVLCAASASAQVGIYGQFDAVHVSSRSSTFISPGWFKGPDGAGYHDLLRLGPVVLGGDVRGNHLYQYPQKYRDVLVGVRLTARPPHLPVRPYAQISVGVGDSSHGGLGNNGIAFNNRFQYWGISGVDYTLTSHIDWRVAELGYGRMTGISSGTSVAGVNLFNVGTGVVVRLP